MAATWQVLRAVELDSLPGLRRAFLAALQAARTDIDLNAVEAALAGHDTEGALALIPIDALTAALEAILPTLEAAAAAARRAIAPSLGATLGGEEVTVRLALPLNQLAPGVLEAIQQDGATLVREVTEETRAAIREAIARAYESHTAPRVAAKQLMQIVGLTRRQSDAVDAYRALLTDEGRDLDQVDRMTARYGKKLLKQRAEMIARTETNAAVNAGQRATWRDLVEAQLLDPSAWRREWLTVLPAPGVCPICLPLDAQTAPLHGVYPDGTDGPPAHPNCRCTEVLVPAAG